MKKGLNIVQIIIYIICGSAILVAVLVFSGKLNIGTKTNTNISGRVVLWGTVPSAVIRSATDLIGDTYPNISITYVQKDEKTYQEELVSALASGKGPDLFLLGPDEIFENQDRLTVVPYATYPELIYKQTFIDQADRFLTPEGILVFPLMVDPMVMYYNRDLLASSFIATPAKSWDDIIAQVPILTKKDDAGKITQSTIALGGFDNITHAKDIIALLLFQAGNSIVRRGLDGTLASSLVALNNDTSASLAITFLSRFGTTNSDLYSWNPSLPDSKTQFLSGSLAYYLGYASEFPELRKQNPNLNMDVVFVPQRASSQGSITYGSITSVGISKLGKQQSVAGTIALWLTDRAQSEKISAAAGLVSARKDVLSTKPRDDAYRALMYQAAIASRGWIDPNSTATDEYFRDAMRNATNQTFAVPQIVQVLNSNLMGLLTPES
jgi:ABC-type glycerol-3-phosphate transport system substrate-binding protein